MMRRRQLKGERGQPLLEEQIGRGNGIRPAANDGFNRSWQILNGSGSFACDVVTLRGPYQIISLGLILRK